MMRWTPVIKEVQNISGKGGSGEPNLGSELRETMSQNQKKVETQPKKEGTGDNLQKKGQAAKSGGVESVPGIKRTIQGERAKMER